MGAEENDPSLKDYLLVLKRRRLLIAFTVVVVVAVSVGYSYLQVPIFEAESQMLIATRDSDSLFNTGTDLRGSDATRQVQTEIQILEGQRVRDLVVQELELDTVPPPVNAFVIGSTDVLGLKVRSPDPIEAATLANEYANQYIKNRREVAIDELLERTKQVQTQISDLDRAIEDLPVGDSGRQALQDQQAVFQQIVRQLQVDTQLKTGGASVVQSAMPPTEPVSPKPLRAAAAATVGGLMVALGMVFALDYFDDSVHSQNELEQISGAPVLAAVPPSAPEGKLPVSVTHPNKPASEAYRSLRTNIKFLALENAVKRIVVTSATISEGKSTTAANLAVVLAQAGHSVALVDADLRRPRVHHFFDTSVSPGLVDWMIEDASVASRRVIVLPSGESMEVVPAGDPPQNPGELLIGNRVRSIIDELSERHDYVIIDSAPVLPVSDTLAIAGRFDGVLLVVDALQARKTNVNESLERLTRIGANIVGIVYNNSKASTSGYYSNNYSYGTAYSVNESSPNSSRARHGRLRGEERRKSDDSHRSTSQLDESEELSALSSRRVALDSIETDIWDEALSPR